MKEIDKKSAIHPIDYRYGSEEIRKIFSVEKFYKTMAYIEYVVIMKQEKYGIIPKGVSDALKKVIETLNVLDIFEEEKRTKHDIMALINVLARKLGRYGEYLHIGLTSADLRDTAKVLIIRESLTIIEEKVIRLIKILLDLAKRYIDLPCVARTHGMHATIYLFGRKFVIFADEFMRHFERLQECKKRIYVGKISGSVGIHSGLGEIGEKIEKEVLDELGLKVDINATQILSRDRFAEIFFILTLISTSLDKLATEIRNLQRTEIGELEEEFGKTQIGSTAMPHKKNPISAENICSLARVLRGLLLTSLENIVLWHERDLTNSGSERILLPEFFVILDEQLAKMINILSRISINKKKIIRNIEMTQGMIFSDILVTKLALRGLGRQRAHELIRLISMECYEKNKDFITTIKENPEIKKYLSETEIEEIFEPNKHLSVAKKRTLETIKKIEEKIENRS
ncbi:MAG: adenylosuccinate lyase [Candidatus Njordarchaeota archaeon]